MKARQYMGAIIMPCACNSSGMRWYTFIGTGVCLRSDTLNGIKRMIRSDRTAGPMPTHKLREVTP